MQNKFIESDDTQKNGYQSEKKVFDAIKEFFSDRECTAKANYFMNFLGNRYTIETDVFLLDKELGLNLFEVKGLRIDNIVSINIEGWKCRKFYSEYIYPEYQLERNSEQIIKFLTEQNMLTKAVNIKPVLVLPYITHKEWKDKGFDKFAFLPPIIFSDDLNEKNKFFSKLQAIPAKHKSVTEITEVEFKELKNIFFGEIKNSDVSKKEKLYDYDNTITDVIGSEEDCLSALLKNL